MIKFLKIDEATRGDILSASSPEPWKNNIKVRARGYVLIYEGCDFSIPENKFKLYFRTNPPPGHTLQSQLIEIVDFWDFFKRLKNEKDESNFSIIHRAIKECDIKVACSCPSWIYGGYKYMATQLDYNAGSPEHRFPKVKNPKVLGSICKHLYLSLLFFPNNVTSFLRDFNNYLNSIDLEDFLNGTDK